MTSLRVARWTALGCLLLVGCAPAAPSTTSPVSAATSTPSPTADCQRLAAEVGRAVQRVVDAYTTTPGGGALPSASATPAVTPPRSAATLTPVASSSEAMPQGASSIQAALDLAELAVAERRCAATAMQTGIEQGLEAVGAVGPVAEAVRARVLAGLHGEIADSPADTVVGPDDDLRLAVAVAPAGTTIRLASGRHELASTLVLLDSVTLRGAGRDVTTLTSSAPDAAVLVISGGGAKLVDLAITRDSGSTGSGIIVGAGSLILEGVRLSGARAAGGSGGAGVLMAASSSSAPGGGTTLEVTGSEFLDNDWAGLAVAGSQQVSIVDSSFTRNGECGLCFLDASGGSVRDSSFLDNRVGVYLTGTAHPAVLGSVLEGGEVGFQIDAKAAPVIEGNRVTGASRAGIIVAGSATGAIADTTCTRVPYGIVVGSSAAPTLTDNTCSLAGGE